MPGYLIGRGAKRVLPRVLKNIISKAARWGLLKRKNVKKRRLKSRQMALGLTANSMYGCLGFLIRDSMGNRWQRSWHR